MRTESVSQAEVMALPTVDALLAKFGGGFVHPQFGLQSDKNWHA